MTESFTVVCVLHGDPPLPGWLRSDDIADRLVVVVNDPGPGRYGILPGTVVVNDRVRGFAENVNQALTRLWSQPGGPDVAVCVNFDLDLEPNSLFLLVRELIDHPEWALAGAVLSDAQGLPIFSVGGWPTPLKELTRAAGLRSGALQRAVRTVLRRSASWRQRNATLQSRSLTAAEYLPWTCVAVRRTDWQRVGPLDERFPLYAEDVDWGRRAAAAGRGAGLVPCGLVVHAERATASATTTAMFEVSHLRLHDKYGDAQAGQAQRVGLALRRQWPLRRMTAPIDWGYLDAAQSEALSRSGESSRAG